MSCRVSLHQGWQPSSEMTRVNPNGCGLSATASLIRQKTDGYAHDVLSRLFFFSLRFLCSAVIETTAALLERRRRHVGRACCATVFYQQRAFSLGSLHDHLLAEIQGLS